MNIETEYKFIIEKPDERILREAADYTESNIVQIYLASVAATHRVRRREYEDGSVSYTENKKVRISKMSSTEFEREITEAEYDELSKNIVSGASPLLKTRRTFSYGGKTFELDYYAAWERTCIMEVELESEDECVELPEFIRVIKDVTGLRDYSNHSMAHSFPAEIV